MKAQRYTYRVSSEPQLPANFPDGDGQLAKLMLLVLVVYIYYVSPIVDENALMKLLFSTGFFLAIALSTLPLVRVLAGSVLFGDGCSMD